MPSFIQVVSFYKESYTFFFCPDFVKNCSPCNAWSIHETVCFWCIIVFVLCGFHLALLSVQNNPTTRIHPTSPFPDTLFPLNRPIQYLTRHEFGHRGWYFRFMRVSASGRWNVTRKCPLLTSRVLESLNLIFELDGQILVNKVSFVKQCHAQ